MAPDRSRGRRAGPGASSVSATTGASPSDNVPPAEPIEGRLAIWVPRAATIGCMGATWVLASRNEGLRGAQALMFAFFGSDASSRAQATYLVSNMMSPILIWTVEANRGRLSTAKLALPSLAGAAMQISGIERIAPIYYLFSMATWDSVYSSEDRILMPSEVANAVLPAPLLVYVLPAALVSLVPLTATGVSQSLFNIQGFVIYAFLSAPVAVPVLTTLISRVTRYVRSKIGPRPWREKATSEGTRPYQSYPSFEVLRSLRSAYAVSFAIQATQHLYTIARNVIQAPRGQRSLTAVLGDLLTYPAVPGHKYGSLALYSAATLGFGLYTVWELRRRGMVSDRDAMGSATGVLAGQVLFGPGATYAGLWWWREGVLAKMRQRT